jgi:urea transport system substrate-binding protein
VEADGASDWPTFAREAQRLIEQEHVCTVFGCWTSASRKTVKPVFEKANHLLIYPVQYEGLEESPNIVYTGAAPNQQIIPAVTWSFNQIGKRFFLVGSDYIFPRTANAIIKDQCKALGAEVVGEEYLLLGATEVKEIVAKIVKSKPDVILNTINGDSNIAFFRALREAGVTPQTIPTMSFSIAEHELQSLNPQLMAGDYAAWNYFQSLPGSANQDFVQAFRSRYGGDRVTDDPIEAAYFGVQLWAQAVQEGGSAEVDSILHCIRRQSFNAPEGIVYVDGETQHTWKMVRIGRIRGDGQFDIMWSSRQPIRPVPFPIYRSRAEWTRFEEDLYQGWGHRWANPGKTAP